MITKEITETLIRALANENMASGEPLKVDSFLVYRMDSDAHANRDQSLRPAGNFEYKGVAYAAYFNTKPVTER